MSYIGNEPISAAFLTDTFSGTGSQTAFTMSVAPANTSSILVAVTGVVQDPSTYSVSGTTLTFSAAPPSGTSNISVRYLGIPASGVTTTAYRTVTNFTATAGQTSFSTPSYTVGYIDVYRNGVYLPSADYTATTGTTVVLNNGCTAGDTVTTISLYVSSVLNAIPATAGSISSTYLASSLSLTTPTLTSPVTAGTPTGVGVLTSGTVQTAPPPTPQYFDFTGIPSWVKRVTINFSGVSTTGSSNYQIQLGTSGGIQSTGYLVNATQITLGAAASTTATSGFRFGSSAYNGTTDIFNGMCQFCLLDSSNGTWSGFGCIGNSASTQSYFTAGSKVLSGTLDRVRITTVGGTDTFDAGSINILYE